MQNIPIDPIVAECFISMGSEFKAFMAYCRLQELQVLGNLTEKELTELQARVNMLLKFETIVSSLIQQHKPK
jgi:hypothetical protein